MDDQPKEDHGALVGWSAQDTGHKLVLRLQSVSTPPPHGDGDVHSFLYVVDKNQAVQLGNYLFEMAGQSNPRRKRTWLDKLIGA